MNNLWAKTEKASALAPEKVGANAPFAPYASSPAPVWVRADADATEQKGLRKPPSILRRRKKLPGESIVPDSHISSGIDESVKTKTKCSFN